MLRPGLGVCLPEVGEVVVLMGNTLQVIVHGWVGLVLQL